MNVVSGESMYVCVYLCVCVCDRRQRIWGIFLAFDGQLNSQLVKTAEQNVPRAKGCWEFSYTHTIKVKCGVEVLFIWDPVVRANSHRVGLGSTG